MRSRLTAHVGRVRPAGFAAGLPAALVLVAVPAAFADDGELTEAEFLGHLTEVHPSFVARLGDLAEADGARAEARVENPVVGFEQEAEPGDAPTLTTWTVTWQPSIGGPRGKEAAAARLGLESREREADWHFLQVRADWRARYAAWWIAAERHDLFTELAERTGDLARRARRRADLGEDSELAALRLELAAGDVRAELGSARADLLATESEARALVPGIADGVSPSAPGLPEPPDGAAATRADVEAARLDVERARELRRAAGRFLEAPAFTGGWSRRDGEESGTVFGVEWEVPLLDRSQGDKRRTEREIAVAEAELRRREAAAGAAPAVLKSYTVLRDAAIERGAGPDGLRILEAAAAEFEAGESALTDFLETLRSVAESRLTRLDLMDRALAAHRGLELCFGPAEPVGGTR